MTDAIGTQDVRHDRNDSEEEEGEVMAVETTVVTATPVVAATDRRTTKKTTETATAKKVKKTLPATSTGASPKSRNSSAASRAKKTTSAVSNDTHGSSETTGARVSNGGSKTTTTKAKSSFKPSSSLAKRLAQERSEGTLPSSPSTTATPPPAASKKQPAPKKKITFVMQTKTPFASPIAPDDAEAMDTEKSPSSRQQARRRRLLQEADDDPIEDWSGSENQDAIVSAPPATASAVPLPPVDDRRDLQKETEKETDGAPAKSDPKTLRKVANAIVDSAASEAKRRIENTKKKKVVAISKKSKTTSTQLDKKRRKPAPKRKRSLTTTEMAGLAMPVKRIKTALGLSLGSRHTVSQPASVMFAAQAEFFIGELVKLSILARRSRLPAYRRSFGIDAIPSKKGGSKTFKTSEKTMAITASAPEMTDGFTVSDIRTALQSPIFSGILPRNLVLPSDVAPGVVNLPPTKKKKLERRKAKIARNTPVD